jgi:hypothetical protein
MLMFELALHEHVRALTITLWVKGVDVGLSKRRTPGIIHITDPCPTSRPKRVQDAVSKHYRTSDSERSAGSFLCRRGVLSMEFPICIRLGYCI